MIDEKKKLQSAEKVDVVDDNLDSNEVDDENLQKSS